ncbi:hypothetical protein [Streptomyces violascens]|uniref:Uncharacterized protein n=1 Tax=Streptomyces violascens TaxID=67381 RepID=A0ABQ3QVW3_9ACTN|nr:hypothetical protein [Streptomyces violascens]GGU27561.1 hypothetical protein GCM10010289_56350 [Streptomyces violascens]GHI41372.1 hypothetical protein Sviol_57800 [Streptomyces violascens]
MLGHAVGQGAQGLVGVGGHGRDGGARQGGVVGRAVDQPVPGHGTGEGLAYEAGDPDRLLAQRLYPRSAG